MLSECLRAELASSRIGVTAVCPGFVSTDIVRNGTYVDGDEAVERLRFIKRAQRFGLKLEAIAELLDVRQRGLCPCGHTRRMLEERVAELDDEMSSLARLRADIATMLDALPEPAAGDWRCSSDLMQIGPRNPFRDRPKEEEEP